MLIHAAYPHVHHEHQDHSHLGISENHAHDHHSDPDDKNSVKKSFFDLIFQSHTHSNHLPQSISINQEKSDLVREDQRLDVAVAIFTECIPPVSLTIESERLENWDNPRITSSFFTCLLLRGPPVLG